jgi:hypothetical protein
VLSTTSADLREISARVRAIMVGQYGADLARAAAELGIGEADLRTLIDLRVPPLSSDALADALAKVVRHFGVDPAWLATGHYDLGSHAEAEETRADPRALRGQIERLLRTPPLDRPVEIQTVNDADREAARADEQSWPAQSRARAGRSRRATEETSQRAPRAADDERAS